jgi:Predicted deacylase
MIAGQAPEVSGDIQVHPLSGMDPVTSPDSGLLLWHTALGDEFEAGTLIAELYRPDRPNAAALGIRARVGGRLIAKRGHPWVRSGDVIAKVSGNQPLAWRTEHLLGGRR